MTENKRFKIADYPSDIEDTVTGKKYAMSSYNTHMEIICDLLNELNDENQQLRKFIMDLQNMIQFDVDNGIKTYPKTLSEYLANALKVMLNE